MLKPGSPLQRVRPPLGLSRPRRSSLCAFVIGAVRRIGADHHVLIVEDDADVRRLTATLLEDEKLRTVECESRKSSLAARH